MREPGIPKLLTWRWAPCLALALGAFSFCAFALLAIPDQIGGLEPGSPSIRLGNQLSRTQATPGAGNWSDSEASGQGDEEGKPSAASPVNHLASRAAGSFPKRGFTPPLDRPEPPPGAAPSPVPPPVPAPPPAAIPAPSPEAEGEAAPAPPPAQTDPAAPAPTAPTAN